MNDDQQGLNTITDPRALLEGLFAESPVAFQVYRADGHCLLVNRAFLDLFGSAPPPEYNLFEDDILERQGYLTQVRRAFAGETIRMPPLWYDPRELRQVVVTDARRVGIQPTLFPLRAANGEVQHVAICVKDVTAELDLKCREEERRQAERALRQSEERYRATFEQAAVGVALVGLEGRWLEVNERLCRIVGYTRAEFLERTFQEITFPADLDADLAYVRRLLAGEIASYSMEKRYVRKDGTLVWIDLSVTLVHGDGEAPGPQYFIAVLQDLSARKAAEQALADTAAQLRQSQKMDAIGRLAGGIAHDFNNLLSVVLGYSELLIESNAHQGNQPVSDELLQIHRAGERAAVLTKQLLAFSRQQVLEPRVVDLNGIVANVDVMMGRLIGEHIELRTILADRPCRVMADQGQLEQILLNLVVNARDAMPGGGRVTIETQNVHLNASYAAKHAGVKPGPHVLLSVTDTGSGMDLATQERAFEPFFTTKEKGKGTGLGLSTVFGLVKQHGGHIWLWSEPGRGATFKIYLPTVEAPTATVSAPPRVSVDDGSETILLVDDDEGVRRVTLSILTRAGYNVLVAGGAAEAMAVSQQHRAPIHLLLTDVVMPLKSGPALAAELNALRPDMAVIFMSGYTDDAIVHHGLIDQDLAFLQKPIIPEVLTRKIREVLGKASPPAAPG